MSTILQKSKQQLTLFFYALSYFTRLPIPRSVSFDNEQFHKANAYLPMIGVIIALVMIVVFYISQLLFSVPVSIILMLIASLLLTGALHEDGFADCCDGLGGGYSAEQRLKIMKDSQIGSYAGVGLMVLFLLKFTLLLELASFNYQMLCSGLLVAYVVSRYGALYLMQTMAYVRLQNGSKVQALATKLSTNYFFFASSCAVCSLFVLNFTNALLVSCAVALGIIILRNIFNKTLQGYTGDCLGFAQQCIEISIFLLLTIGLS